MGPSRLSLLRDEVRYQPSSPDAYFDLGFEYFRLRNYTDAAISYKRVLLSRPHDVEALNNYGVCLFRTRRGDKAREALERGADLGKDNAVVQRNWGVVVDSQGRLAEAVVAYERCAKAARASEKKKHESVARGARGYALERLGKVDLAAAEYDLAADLDPLNHHAKEDAKLGAALLRKRVWEKKALALGKRDQADVPRTDAEKAQEVADARTLDPKSMEMRAQLRSDSYDEQLRQVAKPPPAPERASSPMLTFEALQQPWRPSGEAVWLNGYGDRYLPECKRQPYRFAPSLVPRWRSLKSAQNACLPMGPGGDVDPGGEYVPPRPAYLDPIGDVPRAKPIYHRERIPRTLSLDVLSHRATVRDALGTVGFDSTAIAALGNKGPRLCWAVTPRSRLRFRLPPEEPSREPKGYTEDLADRNPWRQ